MSGLRERKIAKAKVLIQEHAIRLFVAQGFTPTTVEQIAESAEVSPSTFFRYFQTKEAVVLYDSLDPVVIEAIKNQPADLSVIRALRNAIHDTYATLSPDRRKLEMQRFQLLRTVPELQTSTYEEMVRNINLFAEIIAERTNKSVDDLAVRNLAGAIIGVGLAAMLHAYDRPAYMDSVNTFDQALARLEQGLELF